VDCVKITEEITAVVTETPHSLSVSIYDVFLLPLYIFIKGNLVNLNWLGGEVI